MIDLYTWGTPNGRKVSIMLEEVGLPYRVHPIDISKGDQFTDSFVAINPNSKIPAIIDHDGPNGQKLPLFESGAILIYLAEKTGRFLPADPAGRYATLQWLMFQMGGVGPMFGQTHHFRRFAPEPIPYAIERYSKETRRLYGVLDKRLSQSEYVAGDYSIADMAIFPWCQRADWQGIDLAADFPNVKRWYDCVAARPHVQKGMSVPG
ncbi:MAG TPA: glutathione S-transferase N-terminal domain-containing protein [Magnetospirillum sp.]|nr:glutathione S-transferase N-terminal domain-containing protein [Magnetospirillum sp.]